MMFASRTIIEHVFRGIVGIAALVAAVGLATLQGAIPVIAAVLLVGCALFLFRGCPACWTIGLIETVFGPPAGRNVAPDQCDRCRQRQR